MTVQKFVNAPTAAGVEKLVMKLFVAQIYCFLLITATVNVVVGIVSVVVVSSGICCWC